MTNLRLWANYYYNMGFNVTHIIPAKNKGKAKNIYKSPTNDRYKIANVRQSKVDMQNLDWENSLGIGAVLGFNNFRALDFDFHNHSECDKYKFIKKAISLLGLPHNYEWVVKTPNRGFHILFFSKQHKFKVKGNLTKAFTPNVKTYDNIALKQIELRWDKHLVLPPSINQKNNNYKFFNFTPKWEPLEISIDNLYNLLNEFCYDCYFDAYEEVNKNNNEKSSGYNLHLSHYYEDNDMESIEFYTEGEFLDFSPVYYKKDNIQEISTEWIDED